MNTEIGNGSQQQLLILMTHEQLTIIRSFHDKIHLDIPFVYGAPIVGNGKLLSRAGMKTKNQQSWLIISTIYQNHIGQIAELFKFGI